jgi:hypothetical protein
MNIKTLLSIMALAALTACGDGCIESVTQQTDVAVTAPVVVKPNPVLTPEPIFCPQSTGCPPSPTPAPIRPIVVTPSPEPICVRDTSIALVLIDGLLTDNCGNKYGQTTI